jgi:hypothetical protein
LRPQTFCDAVGTQPGFGSEKIPVPVRPFDRMHFPDASSSQHVEPEAVGWSQQKLQKAESWSREIGSISVMVAHRGVVIAQ